MLSVVVSFLCLIHLGTGSTGITRVACLVLVTFFLFFISLFYIDFFSFFYLMAFLFLFFTLGSSNGGCKKEAGSDGRLVDLGQNISVRQKSAGQLSSR